MNGEEPTTPKEPNGPPRSVWINRASFQLGILVLLGFCLHEIFRGTAPLGQNENMIVGGIVSALLLIAKDIGAFHFRRGNGDD